MSLLSYYFSTPQWVVSYSLRLEVTFDTHCYAASIRFHQQECGLFAVATCTEHRDEWLGVGWLARHLPSEAK